MGNKLYVGNLPYSASNDTLSTLFSECGSVASTKIITDRDTGRSKGFGFIEMETSSQAESVIEKYNGFLIDSREIVVNMAKPQVQRSRY
jgi:cold-inducible RNA-binding protein